MDEKEVHTQGDAFEIDYERIKQSFEDVLEKNNEIKNQPDASIFIDFNSDTDARYYTLKDYYPSSVEEQELGYLIDIRNILLIAILCLLILKFYQMLKNNIIAYFS